MLISSVPFFPRRTRPLDLLLILLHSFALNFKGIPYKTEWVEYPDIEALAKKIGAESTTKKTDGRDHYTLPIIHDPSTGAVIADSFAIALYLDKTYPNTPLLFPPNTKSLTSIASSAIGRYISGDFYTIVVLDTWKNLNEASQRYFRQTRESDFGLKLEDFVPAGPVGEAKWNAAERGFDQFNTWITVGGTEFITGDQIAYADIIVASRLIWAKVVFGSQSEEWQRIAGWNGGRLGKFLQSFEKYSTVV